MDKIQGNQGTLRFSHLLAFFPVLVDRDCHMHITLCILADTVARVLETTFTTTHLESLSKPLRSIHTFGVEAIL